MLDLAVALLEAPEPDDPWPLLVSELTTTLGANVGAYARPTRHGWTDLRAWLTGHELPDTAAITETPCAVEHPHLVLFARSGTTSPSTISELMSDRAWRRHPIYLGSCRTFHTLRQASVPLRGPTGRLCAVSACRPGTDFSDQERDYLHDIQPLFTAAWTHVLHLNHWRRQLSQPATARAQIHDRGLTPRELTVLDLLSQGSITRQIAGG